MEDFAGLILRLLGAFYALGAIAGLRRCAMDLLLTRALQALGEPASEETRAEERRVWIQLTLLVLVGLGGIALMALLNLAAVLFLITFGLHALYVFLLAPRLVDPGDPPDAATLTQRGRSLMLYAAVTLLVLAAASAGWLRDARSEPWPVLALAALLALGLVAYAAHLLRGMPRAPSATPPLDLPRPDEPPPPELPMADERLRHAAFLLSPSWNEGALFETETRRPVLDSLPPDMLTEADRDALRHWLGVFREVGDPADPHRCGFTAPDGAARMAAEGQWVFEQLAARLAPCPLRFEPVPWPRLTRHGATAVRVMAEQQVDALWLSDGQGHQPVNPQEFGLSWALALDLHAWALDYDEGMGMDATPRWSEAESAAHEAEGLRLAQRLARELAATGRGHLPVTFWSESEARPVPVTP
ncbi:hypothetical protein KTR66_13175 [Roseococcus sp. SDR]|uniref:hypothetical protein n=1 Tax=Roseococcus sp. SDR TaxID=2835532 RepID=UPI001BCAFDC3|nr:hypothetical protein [Roseococcus sp. SDR]MBS7790956.1 hypothetical protein [Roseococcus sp. SDR]MBV1846270.1 hypothetical protein [Roseococcus sp. SDR]